MNIDFLQQLCNNWPGVTTDVKWDNDFVFSVAGKMYCVCSLEPPLKIAFKVTDEEFEELSVREGFMPAPYMARNKWVLITDPGKLNRKEWEDFVKQSYELVKAKLAKKLQEALGMAEGTTQKVKVQKTREAGKSKTVAAKKKTQPTNKKKNLPKTRKVKK